LLGKLLQLCVAWRLLPCSVETSLSPNCPKNVQSSSEQISSFKSAAHNLHPAMSGFLWLDQLKLLPWGRCPCLGTQGCINVVDRWTGVHLTCWISTWKLSKHFGSFYHVDRPNTIDLSLLGCQPDGGHSQRANLSQQSQCPQVGIWTSICCTNYVIDSSVSFLTSFHLAWEPLVWVIKSNMY